MQYLETKSITSSEFWREFAPQLHISETVWTERDLEPHLSDKGQEFRQLIDQQGYVVADKVHFPHDIARCAAIVEKLHQRGIPHVFAFVYDEFWNMIRSYRRFSDYIFEEQSVLLPDFWIYYVDPKKSGASGWQPHRDRTHKAVKTDDGRPGSLTYWIPLTDATLHNGCIYALPKDKDPHFYDEAAQEHEESHPNFYGDDLPVQSLRALPAPAGSVLFWEQVVYHYGAATTSRGSHPRISVAFEFQRKASPELNKPLISPDVLPDFDTRLRLILKQVKQYAPLHPVAENDTDIASQLIQALKLQTDAEGCPIVESIQGDTVALSSSLSEPQLADSY